MACELAGMVDYQLDWFRTGKPNWDESARPAELPSKAEILAWWDRQTPALEATVPEVTNEIWTTPVDTPFGRMSPLTSVLYLIDNEVHHQGQAYVYLRELGIQPPLSTSAAACPKWAKDAVHRSSHLLAWASPALFSAGPGTSRG
ncbi:DinB family protein [Deinococcus radiophilus]|uniref:DinB family protein n=1 Tax=Deinococcus radiophilus TaxID=32062 RepID=UPI0036066A9C